MSDGDEMVALRLLKKVGPLYAGEITGAPRDEAAAMIKAGKAERLRDKQEPVTAAPAEPVADKAVKSTPKREQRNKLAEMAQASEEDAQDIDALSYNELWALATDVANERDEELESRKGDYLRDYLKQHLG